MTAVARVKVATRRSVTGRATTKSGTSRSDSGLARTARAAHTAVANARSRACARSAAATRSAASETSIPESEPQTTGPIHMSPAAATSAASAGAPQASTARRVRRPAPSVTTIPSALAVQSEAENTRAPPPSSRVHSGAVDPATGTPGLNEKPAPSARLRANWRWIHESSSGNPAAPAIRCSDVRSTASGMARARTTTRTLPRRPKGTTRWVLAHERVASVVDRLATDGEDVEIAAVRKLDLREAERPLGQRAPVVHEPD